MAGFDLGVRPMGDWSMAMTLSRRSVPEDFVVVAGAQPRAVQRVGQGLEQNFVHQRGLAAAGNAGDAGDYAQRNVRGDVLEVVRPRASDGEHARGRAPPGGNGHAALPGEVLARQRIGIGDDLGGRAGGDDVPAVYARAGAHVHNVVGLEHRLLVVLHDDQRVAQIAQMAQRVQQAAIVPLVQADGRLIQNVQHAHQTGADLRCQPDALGFAAGQRAGAARQRQIVQPHVAEEAAAATEPP